MNDKPNCKDVNATVAKGKDMLDSGIEITVFPLSNDKIDKKFKV